MSAFFILAALLVVMALLFLLPGLLRKEPSNSTDQLASNIAIAKEKQAKLAQALANGSIERQAFDEEMSDIENTLAVEARALSSQKTNAKKGGTVAAVVVALFIPIAAGTLYLYLGTPEAINAKALSDKKIAQQEAAKLTEQAPALAELLPNLEQKLLENPDDVAGWTLLGRSYLTISEFDKSTIALTKALALSDEDPDILSMLAEAQAMQAGGDLSGEPSAYLERALAKNPKHEQSRWLMAIATQQSGDQLSAIAQFEALKESAAGNDAALTSINQMIARSKSLQTQGQTVNPPQSAPSKETIDSPSGASEQATTSASPLANVINVTVSISETALADSKPDESVFIYARASSGPPMPLAVSRHQVKDLPISVTLDDTLAMIPAMTLSKFPSVTVGARVSKSGNAIAEAGDWYIEVPDIDSAGGATLELDISVQK